MLELKQSTDFNFYTVSFKFENVQNEPITFSILTL